MIQLDPEAAAPEARPRGAEGSAEAEPAPNQLTWEEQVAGRRLVFTLHPWGTDVEEMGSATALPAPATTRVSIPGPPFSFPGIREWPFSFPGFPGARE